MSTLKVDTIKDTNGVEVYTAKAWVNFDGTFGTSPFTVANGGIRAAGNVSSITDNGTGYYTINFTNAMPDANYSVVFGDSSADSNNDGGWVGIRNGTTPTTSSFVITTDGRITGEYDPVYVYCAIFR